MDRKKFLVYTVISLFIVSLILYIEGGLIGEPIRFQYNNLIYLAIFYGIFFLSSVNFNSGKIFYFALILLFLMLIVSTLLPSNLVNVILFSLVISIIYVSYHKVLNFSRKSSLATFILLGILISSILTIIWQVYNINGFEEGYLLLIFSNLTVFFFINSILFYTITKNVIKPKINKTRLIILTILILLSFYLMFLLLFSDKPFEGGFNNIIEPINCVELNSIQSKKVNLDKSEIIPYIKSYAEEGVIKNGLLYLITNDSIYGESFKKQLINEMNSSKLIDQTLTHKGGQYLMGMKAFYFNEVSNFNPHLFSNKEKEFIQKQFENSVNQIFQPILIDYVYSKVFGKKLDGVYYNQEIGLGSLSIISKVIRNDTQIKQIREYVLENANGWSTNFRNVDDSEFYHHLWLNNAYLMYYSFPEMFNNRRNINMSFDWLLAIYPPKGYPPMINSYSPTAYLDSIIIGEKLTKNPSYRWLLLETIERFKEELDRNEQIESAKFFLGTRYIMELEGKSAITPNYGSCLIFGKTGSVNNPSGLSIDKIALRDGWGDDSLFILLNLRYTGWHRYKSTNSIIQVVYNEPIIVEDIISKKDYWLPKGRWIYRDKKIDRERLNGALIKKRGIDLFIHNLFGFESEWNQNLPHLSELIFFKSSAEVDESRTKIQYANWNHTRDIKLFKKKFILVFDYLESNNLNNKNGISWHLRNIKKIDKMHLVVDGLLDDVNIYFISSNPGYKTVFRNSSEEDPPAGEYHNVDLDVFLVNSNGRESFFLTIIAPESEVENINIKQEGTKVYSIDFIFEENKYNLTIDYNGYYENTLK